MRVELSQGVGDPATRERTRAEPRKSSGPQTRGHVIAGDVQFWTTHIRIGFALLAVESFAVMVYLLLTPHGHARGVLWAISIGCAASGVLVLLFAETVAQREWRATFSFAWTIGSGATVTIVAILDHGPHSPLLTLLWLPIVYAGLALGLRQTLMCGVAGLVELGLVLIVDHLFASVRRGWWPGVLFMDGAGSGGGVMLAWASSMNRIRLQSRDQELSARVAGLATIDPLTGCLN